MYTTYFCTTIGWECYVKHIQTVHSMNPFCSCKPGGYHPTQSIKKFLEVVAIAALSLVLRSEAYQVSVEARKLL